MELFIYGDRDDTIEFVCLEGELEYAVDVRNGVLNNKDTKSEDNKSVTYEVDVFTGSNPTFVIGDMIKVDALYDGVWSFAVGMVQRHSFPRWGPVETSYSNKDTPDHTMSVTIKSIPDDKAFIKRIA